MALKRISRKTTKAPRPVRDRSDSRTRDADAPRPVGQRKRSKSAELKRLEKKRSQQSEAKPTPKKASKKLAVPKSAKPLPKSPTRRLQRSTKALKPKRTQKLTAKAAAPRDASADQLSQEVMVLQVMSGIGVLDDASMGSPALQADANLPSRRVASVNPSNASPFASTSPGISVAARFLESEQLPFDESVAVEPVEPEAESTESHGPFGNEAPAEETDVSLDSSEAQALPILKLPPEKPRPSRRRRPRPATASANANTPAKSKAPAAKAEPHRESYPVWFRRVVLRSRWMTWFVACYVHWIIILVLGALVIPINSDGSSLLLSGAFAAEEPFETNVEFEIPPEALLENIEQPVPTPVPIESLDLSESATADLAESTLPTNFQLGENTQAAAKTAAASELPTLARIDRAPIDAIQEGSFSVWTEPAQPDPGDPYRIVIQIALPEGLDRYNVSDLEGVVVGSDGYRKPIPGNKRGFLNVVDGYARFIVPIVSADEHVRDSIYLRSRLLKETQKLVLEF